MARLGVAWHGGVFIRVGFALNVRVACAYGMAWHGVYGISVTATFWRGDIFGVNDARIFSRMRASAYAARAAAPRAACVACACVACCVRVSRRAHGVARAWRWRASIMASNHAVLWRGVT